MNIPRIPQYEIERQIGEGGMATVYLATQSSLAREVALKIMAPLLVADASFRRRFLQEGKIIARLSHPSIITVYDIGAHKSHLYMALEYAQGGNLSQRIKQGLTVDKALEILKSIAHALDYAHSMGVIHRDVKSANILFRNPDTPLLTDFGVAKGLSSGTPLTLTGVRIGTPRYMSPEQAKGEPVTAQTDLYSLGIIFYEMLVGVCPYEPGPADTPFSISLKHINEPIPQLPPQFVRFQPLLQRLLAKLPAERFSNASDLIAAIESLGPGDKKNSPQANQKATRLSRAAAPSPRGFVEPPSGRRTKSLRDDSTVSARWWPVALLASALTIVGGVRYWSDEPAPKVTGDKPANTAAAAEPVDSDAQIRALGALADIYSKTVAIDPQNRAARDELMSIADQCAELARWHLNMLDRPRARSLLSLGLRLRPGHSQLLALESAMNGGQLDGSSAERWLAVAERHFKAARFYLPIGGNAVESYRNVLILDPRNEYALRRLDEMASVFELAAQANLAEGKRVQATLEVQQGLAIYPNHAGLLALREQVQTVITVPGSR